MAERVQQKYVGQADFVEIVRGRTGYKNMSFTKLSQTPAPYERYGLKIDNGGEYVSYDFIKDVNDDFINLERGISGVPNTVGLNVASPVIRNGAWVTTSSPNYYTSEVGATFTITISGRDLYFNSLRDPRGGRWSLVIDGDTDHPVIVSTWRDSIASNIGEYFKNNIPDVSHTIAGTFIGDDPDHIPSTGAGTSRGWIYFDTSSTTLGTIMAYTSDYRSSAILMNPLSNKEFAMNITKNSVTKWVPDHDEGGVAFKVKEPKFIIDGVITNVSSLTSGSPVSCSDFRLVQHLQIKFSGVSGAIADLYMVHHVDKTGVVSYSGNLKALQSFTINNNYPLMLPLNDTYLNEFITAIGNGRVTTADDSNYPFPIKCIALLEFHQ